MTKTLYFDTATTAMPDWKNRGASWPHMVRLAMATDDGAVPEVCFALPDPHWIFTEGAVQSHGITREYAERHGRPLWTMVASFITAAGAADRIVAFNASFHLKTVAAAAEVAHMDMPITKEMVFCAMNGSRNIVRIPDRSGNIKWPKMTEAYEHFTKRPLIRLPYDAQLDGASVLDAIGMIDRGILAATQGVAA